MGYRTSWLIGSFQNLPEQPITVTVGGVDHDVAVAAGNYYLHDFDTDLSLLAALDAALADAGVVAATGLRQTRLVKSTSLVTFAIVWGTSTLLRDLLGFTGNLSGQTSYIAQRVSPLLWSPARTETSGLAPLGIRGQAVASVYQSQSPYDGSTENISHGEREYARFNWLNVAIDRVWTRDLLGGEYARWFKEIAVPAARWKLYGPMAESSSDVPATPLENGLGPYIVSAERRGVNWEYQRSKGLQWTDRRADIEIACHVSPEFDT